MPAAGVGAETASYAGTDRYARSKAIAERAVLEAAFRAAGVRMRELDVTLGGITVPGDPRGARDGLGADIAADAGAVFNHDLLAEIFGELGRQHAKRGVAAAAGLRSNDDAHRPFGPRRGKRRAGHDHGGE